ncbi:MAG: SoxR reducing system RseC family protein [Bacteroidia bacterium]|nr:SoxR reducing system RseC family protein [Bacteroidia bacterium]
MSANKDIIEHQAVVRSVSDNSAQVEILVRSACASCHAKSMCTASDESRRLIDVTLTPDDNVEVGQVVIIYGSKSWGIKAVLLAYVAPIILILAVLIVANVFAIADDIAGLLAIGILFPYFSLLYALRNKIGRHIVFKITK